MIAAALAMWRTRDLRLTRWRLRVWTRRAKRAADKLAFWTRARG